MADISSVKLPDASEYDVTDAEALHSSDPVNNLNSTSTTLPLAANMGHAIGENLTANENVYGAKNLWNIEKWFNDIGQAFTKSGDVYTTTISDMRTNTNKCVFSDTDIEVTLSAELTASGSMRFYVELFDSNDNNVGSISLSNPTFTGIGCKVRFNFNNTGTVTLTAPMIRDARIIDPTFAPYAETNLQLTRKTSGLSNENLLDNGWFTVNQRGQTNYPSNAYTVDRWSNNVSTAIESNTVVKTNNGVTINNGANLEVGFSQTLESVSDLSGKTLTLSAKINGTIYSNTFVYDTESAISKAVTPNVTISFIGSVKQVSLSITGANTVTNVRAVKLELGTVSTLANDVAPNYTTELLKCQRYFYRILSNSSSAFIAVGFMADLHTFYGTINLPVLMRGTPTSLFGGVLQLYTTGGTEDVSTLLINMRSPQILTIAATIGNSLTVNSPAILMGVANSYIDISADL